MIYFILDVHLNSMTQLETFETLKKDLLKKANAYFTKIEEMNLDHIASSNEQRNLFHLQHELTRSNDVFLFFIHSKGEGMGDVVNSSH